MLLPDYMVQFLQNSCYFLSAAIMCVVANAYFAAVLVPIVVFFVVASRYFRKSIRELKRLESISRSPIFSSFAEALDGLSTVRAFRAAPRLLRAHEARVDFHNGIFLCYWISGNWFGLRCDMVGSAISLGVGLLAMTSAGTGAGVAFVGLALSFAIQFTSLLQWTVRCFVETENNLTSVERLNHYATSIPREQATTAAAAAAAKDSPAVPDAWPEKGAIDIVDLSLRYRPELEPVLRGVSLRVAPGEKLGICGRTGAGKSSLIAALLRLCERHCGAVTIDGRDIAGVPLKTLRERLSLIPQDPFLFATDVRRNLDPFDEHTDAAVWAVLRQVTLADAVRGLAGGLRHAVAEKGANISAGTRQLLCVARALLRRSRVILIDEATANVDTATDAALQAAMRSAFEHSTVLTVAHRVNTILNCDRIAVLSKGRVAEVGTPGELLRREGSEFRALVEQMRRNERRQRSRTLSMSSEEGGEGGGALDF